MSFSIFRDDNSFTLIIITLILQKTILMFKKEKSSKLKIIPTLFKIQQKKFLRKSYKFFNPPTRKNSNIFKKKGKKILLAKKKLFYSKKK